MLVIAGALSLLAGKLHFFRVFGPGLAVAALVVTLVCLTLVPALMGAVGPWLFGSRVREAQAAGPEPVDPPSGARRFVSAAADRQARRRPRRRRVRRPARRRRARGADDLAVRLVHPLPASGERAAADGRRGRRGVRARHPRADRAAARVTGHRRRSSTRSPGCRPSTRASPAWRRCSDPRRPAATRRSASSPRATAARRASSWSCATSRRPRPPSRRSAASSAGRRSCSGRPGLPRGTQASYAGESALSAETVDALVRDLRRVVLVTRDPRRSSCWRCSCARSSRRCSCWPAASSRSPAPSASRRCCCRACSATHDVVYYVPLVGAVMLVGLGSDYNVFIAGRIRDETHRRSFRDAVAAGTSSASRTITVAGVTLAATFALLALVPLLPFRELALLMSLGVLVDALLVRSVLIPALIVLSGRASWWPRAPAPHPPSPEAAARPQRRRTPRGRARPRPPTRGGSRRPWRPRRRRPAPQSLGPPGGDRREEARPSAPPTCWDVLIRPTRARRRRGRAGHRDRHDPGSTSPAPTANSATLGATSAR